MALLGHLATSDTCTGGDKCLEFGWWGASGHSQWWGEGGSSEGCATVELAKLLKAADEGLMQRGTLFELSWSWMNLCRRSFTLDTQVSSDSQESSKITSATGSKSLVYWRMPEEVE